MKAPLDTDRNRSFLTGRTKEGQDMCLPVPSSEMMARVLTKQAARVTAEQRATQHFAEPNWELFEKNLRSAPFRRAVAAAAEADPKLKKYIKTFGGYVGSKDVIAEIKSGSSGKTYRIKDLHTGRWGCNCGDWQYVHSVQGGDCKHIKSVKQSKLVKTSSPFGVAFTTTNRAQRHRKEGKEAKQLRERFYGGNPPKDSLIRALFT